MSPSSSGAHADDKTCDSESDSPAIGEETRARIKGFLEGFIENIVAAYRGREVRPCGTPSLYLSQKSRKGDIKPFHAAIIPPEFLRINQFERGFSTSLGNCFEECARLIALQHHEETVRGYVTIEQVSRAALAEIEQQVRIFESAAERKDDKPALSEMVGAVLDARRTDDLSPLKVTADLYIRAKDGTRYYFEMKSPMPNKGQCLEVTQRLLRFHLIAGEPRPAVRAYFAMAYNPYGPGRSDYNWNFALNYTPFNESVIMAQEFWNIVGGDNTMEELLSIYQEVGREKTKYMLDSLAFGF